MLSRPQWILSTVFHGAFKAACNAVFRTQASSVVQGLGYEVLAQVLEIASPSHVMQLLTTNPNNNLPPYCWWLLDDASSYPQPALYRLPSVTALQQGSAAAVSGAYNSHNP